MIRHHLYIHALRPIILSVRGCIEKNEFIKSDTSYLANMLHKVELNPI